ncbi:MAG: nucleoside deaminase [Antricoccus sp.]
MTVNSSRDYGHAMARALAQAKQAGLRGDVPIGAIIIDDAGSVLAAGHNERDATGDATAHAEIQAIRALSVRRGNWRLDGLTMVVTIEPCTMCAGAIVAARLTKLVFGALEPKTGAVVSLWDVVRDRRLNHQVEVIGPWDLPARLTEPCSQLLLDFFAERRPAAE